MGAWDLNQIQLFHAVVSQNSFTRAAKTLGVSKAYVSKQVAAMEEALGNKLLERNSRNLRPTFAGVQLMQHAHAIMSQYHEIDQLMAELREKPKGRLSVTAPSAFAAHYLTPLLPDFLNQHPAINIRLTLTREPLDLIQDNIDMAIRLSHSPPLDCIARHLGYFQIKLCATPTFLKQHAPIKTPEDLCSLPTLVYGEEEQLTRWPFMIKGEETLIKVSPRFSCNEYDAVLKALFQHQGIARLPSFVIKPFVEASELEEVLENFALPKIPIYAVYKQNIKTPPNTAAFLYFLQEKIGLTANKK